MNTVQHQQIHFDVGTGLKNVIGKDLITDRFIAIFELVKNSFDANAKRIDVIINAHNDEILIRDDGEGMSSTDICKKWFFVARSFKKGATDKTYAGSKGIGRFSCDRLGSTLTLQARKGGESSKVIIDWDRFKENGAGYFNEVNFDIEQAGPELTPDIQTTTGTALKITDLRDSWDEENAAKALSDLQRLRSPFEEAAQTDIWVQFIDSAGICKFNKKVENHVRDILDRKTIHINCLVKHSHIKVTLTDGSLMVYSVDIDNPTSLEEVVFDVFYLNQKAKNNFTRVMGTQPKNYGSIFVYRNNYRVPPYGEPDYDTFGLNQRKNQGFKRYLGHRELLGFINVVDHEEQFKEVSSRDGGFVQKSSINLLTQTYLELIQRPLEAYVQLVNFGDSNIDEVAEEDDTIDKLLNRFRRNFNVLHVEKHTLPEHTRPIASKIQKLNDPDISEADRNRTIREVSSELKSIQGEANQIKRANEQIRRQQIQSENRSATLERIIKRENPELNQFLFHEMSDISGQINASVSEILNAMTPDEKAKFSEYLSDIRQSSDRLASIEQRLRSNSFKDPDDSKIKDLETHIEEYISSKPLIRNKRVELNFKLTGIPTPSRMKVYNFDILLDNLVKNAVDNDCSTIDVVFDAATSQLHFISDSGPIPITPVNDIFKLGISSKIAGTGIGLYMCKKICREFGWGIDVSQRGQKVVDFTISMEKQ